MLHNFMKTGKFTVFGRNL